MGASIDVASENGGAPLGKNPQEFTATIANVIAVGLGQYLKNQGLDDESIFRTAGLKPDTFTERYSRFPIRQLAAALTLSARLGDDSLFGLHFGDWYQPRVLNASNYAINSAPDIRNALISLQIHCNLITGIPTQISENKEYAEMSWILKLAPASPRQMIDFKAMRTLKVIQQAAGPEWRPLRVNLAHEKPENVDEYFRLLGPNIHFDQPENSFRIDRSTMAIPMPDANPDIYHMARNSILNPFPYEQHGKHPVGRFRQFISSQLGKKGVTLASASKHMNMTPQQLRRMLKKHGTCFQCVLDETRKAHASYYLSETETRFSEISFLLGFTDQSTFSRAVKRWLGMTPREMRRKGG